MGRPGTSSEWQLQRNFLADLAVAWMDMGGAPATGHQPSKDPLNANPTSPPPKALDCSPLQASSRHWHVVELDSPVVRLEAQLPMAGLAVERRLELVKCQAARRAVDAPQGGAAVLAAVLKVQDEAGGGRWRETCKKTFHCWVATHTHII